MVGPQKTELNNFDNAVEVGLDGVGLNLAIGNLFVVTYDAATTLIVSGTFLPSVTRPKIMRLLRDVEEVDKEAMVTPWDLLEEDEIWSTGNNIKFAQVTRNGDRNLKPGPQYQKTPQLYWDLAHGGLKQIRLPVSSAA